MNELLAASVVLNIARAMADYLIAECCRVNDPLVRWAVTKFTGLISGCDDYEDALQEARITMLKCVRNLDPAKAKLSTYATFSIRCVMLSWMDRRGKHGFTKLCDAKPIPVDLEWDLRSSRDEHYDGHPVGQLLSFVNDRERDILVSRANGDNLRDIANRYGISRERVRMIALIAAEKIREAVGVE